MATNAEISRWKSQDKFMISRPQGETQFFGDLKDAERSQQRYGGSLYKAAEVRAVKDEGGPRPLRVTIEKKWELVRGDGYCDRDTLTTSRDHYSSQSTGAPTTCEPKVRDTYVQRVRERMIDACSGEIVRERDVYEPVGKPRR